MAKQFRTKSLVKAAFIEASLTLRCEMQLDTDGKALFVFPFEQRSFETANRFNANGVVPAQTFAESSAICGIGATNFVKRFSKCDRQLSL